MVDAAEERRLARARRAEDAHHLAGNHFEGDAFQHLEPPEVLVHALRLDHHVAHSCGRITRMLRLRRCSGVGGSSRDDPRPKCRST